MTTMKIAWVYEPPRLPPSANSVGPDHYAPLVAAVGRYAGLAIPFLEGWLRDVVPTDGFILLNSSHPVVALRECPPEQQAELASRVVPIDVSRSDIFEKVLEKLSLPAAVDSMTRMEWELQQPDTLGARGPYGLRDIGELVGASCLLFKSARYCYLSSPTHQGLPHLLADYLAALHRTRSAGSNDA